MERAVALKTLGRLLGKKLGYRVDTRAPSREEREAAQAALPAAIAERKELDEKTEVRLRRFLEADSEYQALKAARTVARKRVDELGSITRHRKITVGTSEGMFFLVKAEGDSWEEVIDKLTTKEKKVA